MSTYLIGDVQGCFHSLQSLLTEIHYTPEKDRLGFVGDLVNRGPKSLETLDLILSLHSPLVVLGNHDLHFLALYFLGESQFRHISHTLTTLLASPHCKKYVDFLLAQPLLILENSFAMVHAGIPPQWSLTEAKAHADHASHRMLNNPEFFFKTIYGNDPRDWSENLDEPDRTRYIVNALTRLRFCDQTGKLELKNKTATMYHHQFKPWFEWRDSRKDAKNIYFGHWASLEGKCTQSHIFALDTGCVWKNKLTAIRSEDQQLFSVIACD